MILDGKKSFNWKLVENGTSWLQFPRSISKRSHRKTYNAYAIIASSSHALHFLSKITEINILTMSKALNHYFYNYSGVFIQIE